MHYSQVWSIAARLPRGKAYAFSESDIRQAAECQLSSALFDRVRRSDIVDFTNNVKEQFNVDFIENPMTGAWTMRK